MPGTLKDGARIAIVTPYLPPVVGGVSTFVTSLSTGLRLRGYDVRIWGRYGDAIPGVATGPPEKRAFIRRVRTELDRWSPDVVHAQSHWYELATAYRVGSAIGRRTVFTLHTEWSPPSGWMRERMLGRLLRRPDVVTCVSAKRLAVLRERFPRIRRLELVHPGVRKLSSSTETLRRVQEELHLEERFPVLCVLSMMVWNDKVRGLELLVRSLPRILEKYPSATLVFVGGGPLRPRLEGVVEAAGVGPHVRFAGIQDDPGPYVSASDIALHCSYQDVFPQSVLECVSLGIPVVLNREVAEAFPGPPGDLALVAVPSTVEGFAAGVDRLASDGGLRTRLGEAGRRKVEEEFSWRRTVDRFLELYHG